MGLLWKNRSVLFVGITLLKPIIRKNSVAIFAIGRLQMNRFDLALNKSIKIIGVESDQPEYTPEKKLLREISKWGDKALLDKAILCLELAKSYNNRLYMTFNDFEVVAMELMHLKSYQLETIYKRINHKEYEQKT